VSWSVVALGCVIGFYGLLIAGQHYVPSSDSQYWLERLIPAVGLGFRGIVLLAASFTARRHRRRAGIMLLFTMPIAAACLAFPTNFLFTGEHGEILWPSLLAVLGLELLFYFPCVGFLVAIRNQIWGFSLFLILLVPVCLIFAWSPWRQELFPALPKYTALCLGLGLFWLLTEKFDWPPLKAAGSISLRRRIAVAAIAITFVVVLNVAGTLVLAAMQSSLNGPDCTGHPLFAEPLYPGQAVFTARMIRVGHEKNVSGKWVGEWGIGVVQERFWGVPWFASHIVLLTNHVFRERESYFVDGRRSYGFFGRFLPIFEAGPCARSRPLVDATLELRAAREGRPTNGATILGRVILFEGNSDWMHAKPSVVYAGAKVRLTASSGTRTATTDRQGVYEFSGLPSEDYSVTLDLPETQTVYAQPSRIGKERLVQRNVNEQSFVVSWNGSVEGSANDSAGAPAPIALVFAPAPRTLEDFMVQAYAMECEAVERYTEFADAMETHNNLEVAALFRKMATIEGKHAQQIMDGMGWTTAPVAGSGP